MLRDHFDRNCAHDTNPRKDASYLNLHLLCCVISGSTVRLHSRIFSKFRGSISLCFRQVLLLLFCGFCVVDLDNARWATDSLSSHLRHASALDIYRTHFLGMLRLATSLSHRHRLPRHRVNVKNSVTRKISSAHDLTNVLSQISCRLRGRKDLSSTPLMTVALRSHAN